MVSSRQEFSLGHYIYLLVRHRAMTYELCYCWYLNNDTKTRPFTCSLFGHSLTGVEITELNLFTDLKVGKHHTFQTDSITGGFFYHEMPIKLRHKRDKVIGINFYLSTLINHRATKKF